MHATASSDAPRSRFQAFSALRHRDYRYYWFGMLSAVMGLQILWVGQAWLVYDMTRSPLYLGLVGFAQAVPTILLTMFGGVIADRVDRRRLLLLTQSLNAIIVLWLAILLALGWIEVWHLLLAAFLAGAIGAFDQPARMAFTPQLIPREELVNAIALQQMIWQGTRIIGPAIGGVLISTIGIQSCFFITAAAVGGMVLCIAMVRAKHIPAERAEGKHMGHDFMEGIAFIRGQSVVAALIGLTFFNSLFGMSHQVLLPIFAREVYEVGSDGYGLLMGIAGVGAFFSSMLIASMGNYRHKGAMLLLGAVAFGVSLVVFALSHSFMLSLVIMLVSGFVNSLYMTTASASVQMIVPNDLRGRVMGVYSLTWSLLPLGGMVMGGMAALTDAPTAVALGGAVVAGMALLVGFGVREVRTLGARIETRDPRLATA